MVQMEEEKKWQQEKARQSIVRLRAGLGRRAVSGFFRSHGGNKAPKGLHKVYTRPHSVSGKLLDPKQWWLSYSRL